MGILYIVGTPIGNLRDITIRALETLQEVDLILCEDTRVTRKLLSHYHIQKPLLSYHQHSTQEKKDYIFSLLSQGKNLALVSDAGTPGISDPGNELITWLLRRAEAYDQQNRTKTKQLSDFCTIRIVPVPGPSALATLASIAGIPMDMFVFLGYPPHKKGRKKFFEEIVESRHPVIFYESPYRILKSLSELGSILDTQYQISPYGGSPEDRQDTRVVVGRELTKKFETIYRGTIDEILEQLQAGKVRGEFVVVVYQEK